MTDAPRTADDIFCDALDQPAAQRDDFVRHACATPALCAEVLSLLKAHQSATGFMENETAPNEIDLAGTRLGAYRIEREIGAGGMGRVYLAERADDAYRKPVAIKVLKRGMDTDDVVRRFRRERQVLAGLDHPGIARVLDGGATDDGRPYLVMEHVDGIRLDRFCDDRRLDIQGRLSLFRQVCDAVHGAHQRLVVHRDLKPANLLVTADGTVKLLDFGVAKLLSLDEGASDVTRTAARPLTPAYASPEQLRGEPTSTTSDMYSLGIILYELLTGRRPFELTSSSSAHDAARRLTDRPLPRPSTSLSGQTDSDRTSAAERRRTTPDLLRRQLRGDLDWIILRAMDVDPALRYPSAAALSADLQRFLEHEPVEAGPPGRMYRMRKFVRRNFALVAATIVLVLALIAGITLTSTAMVSARRAQQEESQARQIADTVSGYLRNLLAAPNPFDSAGLVDVTREVKVTDVLDRATATIHQELGDDPEVEASVRLTLGRTETALGRYDEAEVHLRRAVTLFASALGEDHLNALAASNHLANLYWQQNRFDEALPIYRRVLEARRRLFGDDAPQTVESKGNLANLYVSTGRPKQALPLAEEVLASRRRAAEVDTTETMIAMGNLANVHRDLENNEAAEALYLEQLAIGIETLGTDHPHVQTCRLNLGTLYYWMERYPDALAMQQTALEGDIQQLGAQHHHTLQARNNIAATLEAMDRYDEAIEMHREVLEAHTEQDGPRARSLIITLANLGSCLRKAEQVDESVAIYARAVDLCREHYEPGYFITAILLGGYGASLADLDRIDEARAALNEARPILVKQFGENHRRVNRVDEVLARLPVMRN